MKVWSESLSFTLLSPICFYTKAQLFEGRLALNPGLNLLTRVSFSIVQKHFLGQFSLLFLRASNHQLVVTTERIKLSFLFKFSNLNSNFALTLGYLNPDLNNLAQHVR